ncbi:MAG: aldose epimerase [Gemmatimonadaceae bacterium]|nr:aldose epimerase [Gemmatimonadaceae bacterium]
MTDDTELELVSGEWRAVVSSHGASLRGLTCADALVVTGYRGAANKQGGQGDVLIPFPGRVAGGRYRWNGVEHQLPLTDKDGPNAIHGFVRKREWTVETRSPHAAAFTLHLDGEPGYPFPLALRVAYRVDETGLSVAASITNTGAQAAPVAMGFHPYFTVGSVLVDSDTLTLPFAEVLEFEQLIPTGRVLPVDEARLDFRTPRAIGSTQFNHCFARPTRGADGLVRVRLANGSMSLAVWMDESFDYCVVYTGDALPSGVARRSIAIEPMTCGSDALNHPEWGLRRLESGSTLAGRWGVALG